MSYDFDGIDDVILNTTTSPVTAVPFTISCWFNADTLSGGNLVNISNTTGGDGFRLVSLSTGGIRASSVVGTVGSSSDTTNTISTGTWNHTVGVYASNTSRTAYLNNTAATTNTTSSIPTSISRINIGSRRNSSINDSFFDGKLAELGIWDVVLTTDELTSLYKGVSCSLVRPQNLVFYAPLIRNMNDISKTALSLSNTTGITISDLHSRIYL